MPKLPNREPGKPFTFEQVVKQLVNTPAKPVDKTGKKGVKSARKTGGAAGR